MQRWEYKIVKLEEDKKVLGRSRGILKEHELNRLGDDGWELIKILSTKSGKIQSEFRDGDLNTLIFKRERK